MRYILFINCLVENDLRECLVNPEVNFCLLNAKGQEVIPFVYSKKIGLLKRYYVDIPDNVIDLIDYLKTKETTCIDIDANNQELLKRNRWFKKKPRI